MTATTRALLAGIGLLAAGCSFTPKHTITAEHAVHQMDAYLRETITSVPNSLNFDHREIWPDDSSGCVKWYTDSDSTGQVTPSVRYTARTSKAQAGEAIGFLHAVVSYWKDKSSSPVEPLPPDGFTLHPYKHYSLTISYYPESRTVELLGVFDGCIWPYGTPQPDDNP